MSKNLIWKMMALMLVLSMFLAACGGEEEPTTAPEETAEETTEETTAPEPTEAPEVKDFVSWYQFDQDNEDPANDEAVGNA
jgi:multiple sugar transport system substrate-binding protein